MGEQQPDDECRRKHRRDDDSEALALHNAVTTLLDASGVVTSRLGRVAGHYPQLMEALQEQVRDSAISSLTDPSWKVLTQKWQTTDPGNFAGVSDRVRDLNEDMFRTAMNGIGVPGPVEAALIFVVPLPFSKPLGELAVMGDVLGIAFAETAPPPDTRAVPWPEAIDSSARTVSGFDAV